MNVGACVTEVFNKADHTQVVRAHRLSQDWLLYVYGNNMTSANHINVARSI